MTTYSIDLDAGQLVHSLRDADRRQEERLTLRATREYVARAEARSELLGLGDEEAEDLSEVAVVGRLEVAPPTEPGGWILRIRVVDELGPRLPEDQAAPDAEEEIGLAEFQTRFVLPETGTIEVEADIESPTAKQRLDRLLAEIRQDKHKSSRAGG